MSSSEPCVHLFYLKISSAPLHCFHFCLILSTVIDPLTVLSAPIHFVLLQRKRTLLSANDLEIIQVSKQFEIYQSILMKDFICVIHEFNFEMDDVINDKLSHLPYNLTTAMLYNNIYVTKTPIVLPKWTPEDMAKRTSKVTPLGTRLNNFITNNISAINCVKPQMYASILLGVNRYYLLQNNRILVSISYVYSLSVACLLIFNICRSETQSVAHFIFKYSLCLEYFFLVLLSFISSKKKFINLFRDLNKFDETLNLSKDLKIIDAGYVCFYWVFGCLVYSCIESVIVYLFLTIFLDDTAVSFYAMLTSHDYEQVMFFILLRNIYLRLRILKAHVSKMFNLEVATDNRRRKLNKVEELANNVRLDISSLHHVYDLLHKCADQLNSAMSLQMTIILLTAGISTTMLLKMIVMIIQTVTINNAFGRSTVIYMFSRAMKYTGFIVMSCYYSSITTTQVAAIRTMLNDAFQSYPLDKIERRKLKAFFLLTKENEFAYALGGVIKLNMSLPLSYISLCTTYLVISMQFSKYFDITYVQGLGNR